MILKEFDDMIPCIDDELIRPWVARSLGAPLATGCLQILPYIEKEKSQIYVNGDITTLKIGDRVYHSRPEKGEKFDLEKGILVCLAKSCGYTTTDILKLKDTAKVQRKKAKNKK